MNGDVTRPIDSPHNCNQNFIVMFPFSDTNFVQYRYWIVEGNVLNKISCLILFRDEIRSDRILCSPCCANHYFFS